MKALYLMKLAMKLSEARRMWGRKCVKVENNNSIPMIKEGSRSMQNPCKLPRE
jgi:hypothetical protein